MTLSSTSSANVAPVPSGRDEKGPRRFARWVTIGIFVNVAFAIPALLTPTVLGDFLGLSQAQTLWLRNVGLLLLILSVLYAPVAVNPRANRTYSTLVVVARFMAAAFWLIMAIKTGWQRVVVGSLVVDGGLGIIQAFALRAAFSPPALLGRKPYRRSFLSRAIGAVFRAINRLIPWHRLPKWIGVANLWSLRNDLREWNLKDTYRFTVDAKAKKTGTGSGSREERSPDGSGNDVFDRRMGGAGTRFGRNSPFDASWPDNANLLEPNPREVAVKLMQRREFVPATTLNLLAAAWIQFQNHGWFNHQRSKEEENAHRVPIPDGDEWPRNPKLGKPRSEMVIHRTKPDGTRPAGSAGPPTFISTESHWWDQSQVYGSSFAQQKLLRTFEGGKMKVEKGRFLPLDPRSELENGIDLTGFNDNYWVGLSLLHTLFVWEHNAICDMLAGHYPHWDDGTLFEKARLINGALAAKIHTVEWTPGILATPVLRVAMDANWWGLLGEEFYKKHGRVSKGEALSGIMGSQADHHAAPYYLTEEFAAVYRLHSLIPDEVVFRRVADHGEIERRSFTDIQGIHTRPAMENLGSLEDQMYTMGVEHPGAITLHNFPRTLMEFQRANGDVLDLAAIDVLRDRERGVPRYNDFRRMLRMKPCRTFREMTDNEAWARELEEVYKHPDLVDLQVGMLAEPLPKGFGFSDTAFRIFILMASRRLKSDRFFTDDYRPGIYTEEGMKWIQDNTMIDVLKRHFSNLGPALEGVENAFAPWKPQR